MSELTVSKGKPTFTLTLNEDELFVLYRQTGSADYNKTIETTLEFEGVAIDGQFIYKNSIYKGLYDYFKENPYGEAQ